MIRAIGVDFGTTNSVVALLHDDGRVATQRHAALDVFRSVLCFWTEETAARRVLRQEAGPEAIAAYLEDPLDSRLIMSMKTYLAQRSFSETRIFGHPFTLERLIGRFLAALLADTTSASRVIVAAPCVSQASWSTMHWAPTVCAALTRRPVCGTYPWRSNRKPPAPASPARSPNPQRC